MISLFYGFLAGLATFIGIWIFLLNEAKGKKYGAHFMTFAAGVILAVAFLHLIPEAQELNDQAIFYVFIGFLIFYLMESYLFIHAGPEMHHIEHAKEKKTHITGQIAFLGLLFHSFIDGITIGIGFEIGPTLGLLTALGIILHELPEGIATFSILILSDSKKTALKKSYLVALATPLGTVISLSFIHQIPDPIIGMLLAIVAGSFIYVAGSDLIPATHEHKGILNTTILLAGVFMIYFLSLL